MFATNVRHYIVYENLYYGRDPRAGVQGMIWWPSIRFLASFIFFSSRGERDKCGIVSRMARQARIPGASNQTLNPHFRSSVDNARRGLDVPARKNRTGGPKERLRSAREPRIAGWKTRENSWRRLPESPLIRLSAHLIIGSRRARRNRGRLRALHTKVIKTAWLRS